MPKDLMDILLEAKCCLNVCSDQIVPCIKPVLYVAYTTELEVAC